MKKSKPSLIEADHIGDIVSEKQVDESLVETAFIGEPIVDDESFEDPTFTVPKGSALNCRHRIVAAGEVVTPDMVIGGTETLEYLASQGALIKSK